MKNYKRRDTITRVMMVITVIMLLIAGAMLSAADDKMNEMAKEKEELHIKYIDEAEKADSLQLELDKLHEINLRNVEYWIDTLDIAHKDIVMRQVILETGNLSSAICRENYNLFGMKEPKIRETTALGTKRGHAFYLNYIDSIKDYKLWQKARRVGEEDDYYHFLSSVGYAEANNYINALKSI